MADGKKTAIGLGIAGAGVAVILLATRKAGAAPPPPEPGLASVYGQIKDAVTKQVIPGVAISLNGYSALTDGSGNYNIENITPRGYLITLAKEGYIMAQQDITLTAGLNELNVSLTPVAPPPTVYATLFGRVTNAQTGAVLSGVTVSLWSPDGTELLLQKTTDSGGNYKMENIYPGNYLVVFEKAGYQTQ